MMSLRSIWSLAGLAMLAGISLAACRARPQAMAASAPGIGVEISAISCPNVVVAPGMYVNWINVDADPHIVRHAPAEGEPQFSSRLLKQGDHFELKFEENGSYPYECSEDGSMLLGTITVVKQGDKIDAVLPVNRNYM